MPGVGIVKIFFPAQMPISDWRPAQVHGPSPRTATRIDAGRETQPPRDRQLQRGRPCRFSAKWLFSSTSLSEQQGGWICRRNFARPPA